MFCARSFYTCSWEIYVGSRPEGPLKIYNSSKSEVDRMVQLISMSNRNVTHDNWFYIIPLCAKLLQNHRLTLTDTLRKNKKEIPLSFGDLKHLSVGGLQVGFTNRTIGVL